MIRWGLCCHFLDSPIKFRAATHRYVASLQSRAGRRYLTEIARHNAQALIAAVERCHQLDIGAFRITSQILPLATHPESGYLLERLDPSGEIEATFSLAGDLARSYDVRLSFHPDQFVVLNSAFERVTQLALDELELQGSIAELIGADTIVLHAGGATGGVPAALERLARGLERLSPATREKIALENDDHHFAPNDLAPLCRREAIPLVYDVHHHRCHPDGLSVEQATQLAAETWDGREPWCHISSPKYGWFAVNPRPHADYVDPDDFPAEWMGRTLTVDVEAKAKERAVLALKAASARPLTAPPGAPSSETFPTTSRESRASRPSARY